MVSSTSYAPILTHSYELWSLNTFEYRNVNMWNTFRRRILTVTGRKVPRVYNCIMIACTCTVISSYIAYMRVYTECCFMRNNWIYDDDYIYDDFSY